LTPVASGSVQTVADKTVAAKDQIAKLQEMLKAQSEENKTTFYEKIESHLADAKVNDAREVDYNDAIKTEYTSDFQLDQIAAVVTSSLKAAVELAKEVEVPESALLPGAISAYTDLVNTVAEAAKSSSTSAASLSFSMNRLSPGLFAFLYASSVNIQDVDTFGSEAVTSTAIYYRFMQSIDDVKNQAEFGEAIIDANNLLHMKTLQAGLTDDLASGKIDIDEWTKKDAAYSAAINRIQKRLDGHKFDTAKPFMLAVEAGFGAPVRHSFATGSAVNQEVVRAAIERLSAMGEAYKAVVEISKARLASVYY
jgi:hypothetical protein